MAPQWITPAGSLGIARELEPFAFNLQVVTSNITATFSVISGSLPTGLDLDPRGYISGFPVGRISGVPLEVGEDVVSTFVVRVTDARGSIADRTFNITVTGETAPKPVITNTPENNFFYFVGGTYVDLDLSAVDPDPGDVLTYEIVEGQLPNGLSLSDTGHVIGWPTYSLDTNAANISAVDSEFVLAVSDSKITVQTRYTLRIFRPSLLTAGNANLVTGDVSAYLDNLMVPPRLLNYTDNIGTFLDNNWFFYQFQGEDFNGNVFTISLRDSANVSNIATLPSGLTFDGVTGWLYGYIDPLFVGSENYEFNVRVQSSSVAPVNELGNTSYWPTQLTITNNDNFLIEWITDENLGEITAATPCVLNVSAVSTAPITYSLVSGQLPRGLTLDANGLILGRPSQQLLHFNDLTTFDQGTTTFDRIVRFTIQATASFTEPRAQTITSTREFYCTVLDYKLMPASNLSLEFLIPTADRELLRSTMEDGAVVPYEYIYRPSDSNFGKQTALRMLLGYGLDTFADQYLVSAMQQYHHKKRYVFESLHWAQATDDSGNVLYEVIYIQPRDFYTNLQDQSFTGRYTVNGSPITADTEDIESSEDLIYVSDVRTLYAYPATHPNAINQIKTFVSDMDRKYLPLWMRSPQPNGDILNLIPAVPVVFCKPQTGKIILKNLQDTLSFGNIHFVDAQVDRYVWDDGLAMNFDKTTNAYLPLTMTTFDRLITDANVWILEKTVDLVTANSFSDLQSINANAAVAAGLFDGFTGDINGKTLIFLNQEYAGGANVGWLNFNPVYDTADTFGVNYESFTVINGYTEHSANANIVNERGGIWRINVVDEVINLSFEEPITYTGSAPFYGVFVLNGLTYRGKSLAYVDPTTLGVGYTVPSWYNITDSVTSNVTIFDEDSTRFIDDTPDQYLTVDQGSQWVEFPKQTVLDHPVVTV